MALFILASFNFSGLRAQTPTATPAPSAAQNELNQLNGEVIKLYSANQLDKALPLAEKVVQRTQALLGADSEQLVTAWKNLGEIQMARKKYGAAVASFEQAAKVQEAKLGANALPLAATLMRLGLAYFQDSQTDGAEKSFARALAIREAQLSANSPLIAESADLLGQIYDFKKDWGKAAPLYQRAFFIKETLQPKPDDVALAGEKYACMMGKAGRQTEYEAEAEKRRQANANKPPSTDIVNGGIMNGKALVLPRPIYSSEAKKARATGTVSVKILVDEQGRVLHACAITGAPLLRDGSVESAYQAKFPPTSVVNKPVKVIGILNYNYQIQ